MSLSNISIHLEKVDDYDWSDGTIKASPLSIYIRGTNETKREVLYEVMVIRVINNDLTYGTNSEQIKVELRETDDVETLYLDLSKPFSAWDILDIDINVLMDMFFGDIIEVEGREIDYINMSAKELGHRLIKEDTNNYSSEGQDTRLSKRLGIALKLAYVLGDEIGKRMRYHIDINNKKVDRYENTFVSAINIIKGKQ